MLSEPLEVVRRIAAALGRLRVRYVVGGSLASSVYGVPRATQDVAIVAEITIEKATEFAALLASEFYVDLNLA